MTINELNKDQFDELKEVFYNMIYDDDTFVTELMQLYYNGINFVDDDFVCSSK